MLTFSSEMCSQKWNLRWYYSYLETAIILVPMSSVANDATQYVRPARHCNREKLLFKWCALKCAELTIGAKERRCFSTRRVTDKFNESVVALWRRKGVT